MVHKLRVSIGAFLLILSSQAYADVSCYVVDRDGAGRWIPYWDRIVIREIEPLAEGVEGEVQTGFVDSPRIVSAFLYRGALIPVRDLTYMLPTLGVYAFKDGHLVEANPLARCGFSSEHRLVDLEHQRHRATAGGMETEARPTVPLLLEAYVEFASTDTIAGYPVAEPGLLPLHDARIVVLDPKAVALAEQDWSARLAPAGEAEVFSPFVTRLSRPADLYRAPDGQNLGKVKKGETVEVLELRGEWARIRAEGWVRREAVEEKKP